MAEKLNQIAQRWLALIAVVCTVLTAVITPVVQWTLMGSTIAQHEKILLDGKARREALEQRVIKDEFEIKSIAAWNDRQDLICSNIVQSIGGMAVNLERLNANLEKHTSKP